MSHNGIGNRALAILMAITMFGGILTAFVPDERMLASAGAIPSTINGDWTVSNYVRYDGGSCVLTGSLVIPTGGTLVLNNLTLALNNAFDDEYTINLDAGGVLRIFNSTIKSNNNYQSGNFVSYGTLQVENSTLRDFGVQYNWEGIFLYGGSAIIKNDTIADNDMGLLISGAMPTVEDTIFDSNMEAGIWCDMGSPTFRNVTITKTGQSWGGYATWSGNTATFINSNIKNNLGNGLDIMDSGVDLYNCTVTGNNVDVYLEGWGGTTSANMYNSKYVTKSLQDFGGGGTVVIKAYWYVNITATWQSDGAPVDGGTYTVFDKSGGQLTSDILDANGQKLQLAVKEYEEKPTGKTTFTPHVFNVTGNRNTVTRSNQTVPTMVQKTTEVAFTLDDVPPVLHITEPPEGLATNKTSVTLSGYTEPMARAWVGSTLLAVDAGGGFTTTVNLVSEGKNNFRLKAVDLVGNERDAEVNVTRDTIAPVLTIDEPKDGDLFNFTAIKVQGATEKGAILKVNGNAVTVANDGKYNTTLTLPEGIDPITVTSKDAVGNSVTLRLNVTIDLTPPRLDIGEPKEGFRTRDSSVTVKGFTEVKSSVTVKGVGVPVSGTMFQMTVSLVEGMNRITVKACDKAKNCVIKMVNGTRDSLPPALQVSTPPSIDEVLTNKETFQVNGTTETGATVTINAKAADVEADGSFTMTVDLKEGDNTFTVVAVDGYGNTAQLVRKVRRDSIPPALDVTSPKADLRTKEKTVAVQGEAEAGAVLTINANRVSFTGTAFSKDMPLDKEGENDFTVIATDKAGNFNVVHLKVIRKTQVLLKINMPVNGTKTKNETVAVEGLTDPGATVEVGGLEVVASGTGKFRVVMNLTIGENAIDVKAIDDLGNTATGIVLVVREKKQEPPKPPIGPGAGFNGLLVPLLLVVVVIAAVCGGVGYYAMKKKKKGDQAPPPQQPPTEPQMQPAMQSVPPQPPQQGYGGYNQYGGQAYLPPPLPPPPPPPPSYPGY